MVKSRCFCNFLQARFLLYRSMSVTPSASRSSLRRYSSSSRMSKSHYMHYCCLKLFIHRHNLERQSIILG